MKHREWALSLAVLWLTPAVFGQQLAVDFDPSATKINWTLVGNVHTTHGTFQLKRGHVDVNAANGQISGELLVEAESGQSGNSARDKRMKTEILETQTYPEIRFKATKLEGAELRKSETPVRVTGQLIIHGTSHEATIPLQITLTGNDFSGSGKFVIPYVDWGMKDPSNFLFKVGKTVEVELEAVGHVRRQTS